ncbi:MAG: hypothetical protein ACYCVN_07840 [Acidimicrobiales bacterium]
MTSGAVDRLGDSVGSGRARVPTGATPLSRIRWMAVISVYLALAFGLWWGVWTSHPTSVTTCGCGDAARFLWFFEWPAYAIAHGRSLFYSTALFHPGGINLLDDTSVLAFGVPLVPITWIFGPVASMNLGLTLAPAISALTMFALLRRWTAWAPAAFLGGLAYGFSPFVVSELALNQLNIAMIGLLPLVVICLDELIVVQRRSARRIGLALALVGAVQFFVSTEVFLIALVAAAAGMALLGVGAAIRPPDDLSVRLHHALSGLVVAAGMTALLLAYPLWFLLDGPAHLTGPIWSVGSIDRFGNTLASFVTTGGLAQLRPEMLALGGYQGPPLVGLGYLGTGMVAVVVVGMIAFRRERRLWLFGGVGIVSALLSLGPGHGVWVPWDALSRLPWVGDIVEVRFSLVVTLCVSVLFSLVLDRSKEALVRRRASSAQRHRAALLLPWMLVAVAMLPSLVALWPNLPLTTRSVVLPRWYSAVGATLPAGKVLLAYPAPFSGLQSSQAWQAVNEMRWAQAGGGGPEGQASRAGDARRGFEVLFGASLPLGAPPGPTPANLAAVRRALALWRVTTIVVPDEPELPRYQQGRSAAYAVGLFTAVVGRAPLVRHSAFVWTSVGHPARAVPLSHGVFAACTVGTMATGRGLTGIPRCVLAAR